MNEDKSIDWKAMIDKLSSYSGTIKDFCKENVSDGTHTVFTKNELSQLCGSSFLVKAFFSNLFYIIVLFFYKFFEFRF